MPAAPPTTRVLALDAVRGVAILGVIATHSLSATVAATGSYAIPGPMFRFFDFGQFGVHLFFALSGWLMFSLYRADKPFSAAAYWARRIARIWPLWLIFLALSYLAWGAPETPWPTWVNFVLAALFLGWVSGPLVTLPIGGLTIQQEMGHYTLFALFRRRSAGFLAATVLVGYASLMLVRFLQDQVAPWSVSWAVLEAWVRLQLYNSWPFFLLGGLGCVVYRRWRDSGVRAAAPDRPWHGVVIAAAVLVAMFSTYAQDTPGFFVAGWVLVAAGFAVAANSIPVIGPALRSIGKYSYFIYFAHFFVLRWLEGRYRDSGLPTGDTSMLRNVAVLLSMTAIALVASWAVGWVSWRVLERPILDLAHRKVPNPASIA